MASYTITITPEDGDGTTTTLRLDVTRGVATLTDVHLHAGAGLSAGQLPTIDYAMLLRAVGQEGAPAKAAGRKATGRGRQPAKRAGRAAAAEPVKATRARVAAKTTARGAGGGGGRAYRRMPDDLASVFKQAGGATAVAAHYGVPRHTVQGWLRRLRSQGVLPA
jgi:hypothetical protein